MSRFDPLHLPGGRTTHPTTVNAEENLPGVVTPLDEEQLFSNARQGQSSIRRYPIVAVKAPRAAAAVAGRINRVFARSERWWRESLAQAGTDTRERSRDRLASAPSSRAASARSRRPRW